MTIANASERNGYVAVYNEKGNQLCVIPIGRGGKLLGFTSTTVSIDNNGYVATYNEKGRQVSVRPR